MGIFIWTQAHTKSEPLVPLELFKDRNFAASNTAIATVGFAVTSMSLPLMFFIQLARGLTPTAVGAAAHPDGGPLGCARSVRRAAARPHRSALPAHSGHPDVRGLAPVVLVAHERRHSDLDVPPALGPHGHRQRRNVGAARNHRDAQPACAAGRGRVGHLQHDPHGRLGHRIGRHRGLHAEPARGATPWRLAGHGRVQRREAPAVRASRASRPPWRSPSCFPRACC